RGPQWVVAVGLRGPVSGRRSRTKGASVEREVARQLRALWPGARRGIGQARSGGETPDVIQTPFWIEAKHRKKCSIPAAYRQAVEATDGRPVLVITKEDRAEPLVTMTLADWLQWTKTEKTS